MSANIFLYSQSAHLAQLIESQTRRISHCRLTLAPQVSLDNDPGGNCCLVFVDAGTVDAHAVLRRYRGRDCAVVVLAGDEGAEMRLKWFRAGATDCLKLPHAFDRVAFLIDVLTARHRLESSHRTPERTSSHLAKMSLPRSPSMLNLLRDIERIAATEHNVLLSGETGCGKSRLARLIHGISSRSKSPFVVVNCAALPEPLVESELFGHSQGAFTGADSQRTGKFQEAGDGTLFLDEIDTLSLAIQAKLLRAVDERTFEAIGCNRSQFFKGRLIVASNQNLEELVKRQLFRPDLFFRLTVAELSIPPLRERPADILPLAQDFLTEQTREANRESPSRLSIGAQNALLRYHWPGNIRELRHAIEIAVTMCSGDEIDVADLPKRVVIGSDGSQLVPSGSPEFAGPHGPLPGSAASSSQATLAEARDSSECRYIRETLARFHNNRSRAAKEMGISRTSLYRKLVKYGLHDLKESPSNS